MKGLNSRALKMVAVGTMLTDHIGAALLLPILRTLQNPEMYAALNMLYTICRKVGRISFPIFCLLLVEGFVHTKDLKKYACRLALFAIVSEIPFDLAFYHTPSYLGHQNVFFTLLIGLLTLAGMKWFIEYGQKNVMVSVIGQMTVVACAILVAILLKTDYSVYGSGVLAIVLFYYFRDDVFGKLIAGAAVFSWEFPAPLAMIPIWFYNGEKGKGGKYIFYLFYPVHLIILWAVAMICIR